MFSSLKPQGWCFGSIGHFQGSSQGPSMYTTPPPEKVRVKTSCIEWEQWIVKNPSFSHRSENAMVLVATPGCIFFRWTQTSFFHLAHQQRGQQFCFGRVFGGWVEDMRRCLDQSANLMSLVCVFVGLSPWIGGSEGFSEGLNPLSHLVYLKHLPIAVGKMYENTSNTMNLTIPLNHLDHWHPQTMKHAGLY